MQFGGHLLAVVMAMAVAATPARAERQWPAEFRLSDVVLTVERHDTFCFGGSIVTVRVDGRGDGEHCVASPDHVKDAGPPQCTRFGVSREQMLEYLEALHAARFFALRSSTELPGVFMVDAEGRVHDRIVFVSASSTTWHARLDLGRAIHEVSWTSGMPCELVDLAGLLLAGGTTDPDTLPSAGAPQP